MDYYSYGYGGPGNESYRAIYHSSDAKTYITKNVWGELTAVRQWGTQQGHTVDQKNYYYYDSKRRLCRYRNATVGDKVYQYDNANRLTAYQEGLSAGSACSTPSGSAKVSLTLDAMGRLTNQNFADSGTPDIGFTYDLDGNVLTTNRGGINWTYSYNNLSMLEDETLTVDGRTYLIDYGFDNSGALSQMTYPTGDVVTFNPDGLGRPQQAKHDSTYYANNVQYHYSGAIGQLSYGNGHDFNQIFNSRLFPEHLSSIKGATKALDLTYTYDSRGSIISIDDASPSNHDLTLGYDSLNRLTSASGSWGSGSVDYDAMGNVRYKDLGPRSITVNYDSNYRVTSSVDVGNLGGNTGTRSFQHDSRGNVTTAGGLNFTYDYANQPVSMTGTSSGSYSYDGNLKRVKSVVNGETIYNVFSQSGKLIHIDNDTTNEETDYISINNQSISRVTNNTPTYLHNDVLGSPVAGTNTSGGIAFTERYTPFGITLDNDASNDNQAGFTGHIKDADTGLTYMQARYYDPVIGRFYSNDPIGFRGVHSFNRYAYANNNPYKYVDPDGKAAAAALALIPPPIGVTNSPSSKSRQGLPPLSGSPISGGNTGTSGSLPNIPASIKLITKLVTLIPTITIDNIMNSDSQKGKDNEPKSTLPRDKSGNYLPDADADGAHTTLGTRQGNNGDYTQGATFDNTGQFTGRTDVTDHGRKDHDSPHVHPATVQTVLDLPKK